MRASKLFVFPQFDGPQKAACILSGSKSPCRFVHLSHSTTASKFSIGTLLIALQSS